LTHGGCGARVRDDLSGAWLFEGGGGGGVGGMADDCRARPGLTGCVQVQDAVERWGAEHVWGGGGVVGGELMRVPEGPGVWCRVWGGAFAGVRGESIVSVGYGVLVLQGLGGSRRVA